MKNNKLKPALFSLALITVCVLLASCNDIFKPQETAEPQQTETLAALDRFDELALLHNSNDFEVPVDELQARVNAMLQLNFEAAAQRGEAPVSAGSITGERTFSVIVDDGFSSLPANRRPPDAEPERSEILFYVFDLVNGTDTGFALASGDARIGSVIAVVEDGSFDDTENPYMVLFHSLLEGYIYRTIDEYNCITDQDIAMAKLRAQGVRSVVLPSGWNEPIACVEPLTIGTQWDQHTPYNDVINITAGKAPNTWVTGCAATAIAQIMAYHKWPEVPHDPIRVPSANPTHQTPRVYSFTNPYDLTKTIYFSGITYDWAGMTANPKANNSDVTSESKMHIGVLMMAIGDRVGMKYNTAVNGGSAPSG